MFLATGLPHQPLLWKLEPKHVEMNITAIFRKENETDVHQEVEVLRSLCHCISKNIFIISFLLIDTGL